MILIDSGFGASANIGIEGLKQEARMRNMTFYGATESPDCVQQDVCKQDGVMDYACI
jgi:hypothetical protein